MIFDLWRQWLWPTVGLAVVNGWAVAATFDEPRPRAAAAAAAAIVTAAIVPRSVESTLAGTALLAVLPFALIEPALLAPALVVIATGQLIASRTLDHLVGLAGATLTAAAITLTAIDGYGWRLLPSGETAAVLAVAGALVTLASRNPVLMAPTLLAAAIAMPVAPDPHAAAACAIAAVALAAFDRPGPAIAAVGLAAAADPATVAPAFFLLAAGALVAAVPWRPLLLAAVPGAVALTAALSQAPEAAPALALAAVAALLAWRGAPAASATPEPHHTPALVLLAWLTLLPATWRWTGADFHDVIDPYQQGVAIAAAAAVLAWAAANVVRHRHAPQTDIESPS